MFKRDVLGVSKKKGKLKDSPIISLNENERLFKKFWSMPVGNNKIWIILHFNQVGESRVVPDS